MIDAESIVCFASSGHKLLMSINKTSAKTVAIILGALVLSSCEGVTVEPAERRVTEQNERIRQQSGTFHGNDKGIVIYSTREGDDEDDSSASGLNTQAADAPGAGGANSYLWRASLESLDFMPLLQADSRGGVIISDWYAPPETPDERFKVTVYILDQVLRADAVKVTVFRQTSGANGWVDSEVDPATATGLEENILDRARELRLANTG